MNKNLFYVIPLAAIAFFVGRLTLSSKTESKQETSITDHAEISSSDLDKVSEAVPKIQPEDTRSTERVIKPVAKRKNKKKEKGFMGMPKELLDQAKKMQQNSRDSKNATEIARLQKALGLNDEQVKQLEGFYVSKAEIEDLTMEKVLGGGDLKGLSKDAEIVKMTEDLAHADISSLFDEILTEDQTADYATYKENKETQQKEATAYRELATLQGSVSMTDDQKDAVFSIFNEQAYKQGDADVNIPKDIKDAGSTYLKNRKLENKRLFESLSTVLDADQLEIYKQEKESQIKMIEQSMKMSKQFGL